MLKALNCSIVVDRYTMKLYYNWSVLRVHVLPKLSPLNFMLSSLYHRITFERFNSISISIDNSSTRNQLKNNLFIDVIWFSFYYRLGNLNFD